MEKQFIKWLGTSTFARSKGGIPGAHLETGGIYNVEAFDAAVVAEWIRTGHAEPYVNGAPTDTTLNVKNATVALKTPKLGAI